MLTDEEEKNLSELIFKIVRHALEVYKPDIKNGIILDSGFLIEDGQFYFISITAIPRNPLRELNDE